MLASGATTPTPTHTQWGLPGGDDGAHQQPPRARRTGWWWA